MNGEETLQVKQAFERVAASHNVTVKHYHCDNSLFDSAIFAKHIAAPIKPFPFAVLMDIIRMVKLNVSFMIVLMVHVLPFFIQHIAGQKQSMSLYGQLLSSIMSILKTIYS